MALPATDDFSPDEAPLATNWTTVYSNNNCRAASGVGDSYALELEAGVWWDSDAFSDDQYSQFKIAGLQSSSRGSQKVIVRCASGAKTLYCFGTDNCTDWQTQKCVAGSWTTIVTDTGHTAVVGDIVKITVSGANPSVIHGIINAGEHDFDDNSDSTIDSGGAAGWIVYYPNSTVDDWEGGDLGAVVENKATKFAKPAAIMRGMNHHMWAESDFLTPVGGI